MATLSKAEVQARLSSMPEWSQAGHTIHRKYAFKSFMPAIDFVNRIAAAAEKAGHHPDITINYSVVAISLSTHSEGGITEKDFQLAAEIDRIAAPGT